MSFFLNLSSQLILTKLIYDFYIGKKFKSIYENYNKQNLNHRLKFSNFNF
jgi:hypothetical protein